MERLAGLNPVIRRVNISDDCAVSKAVDSHVAYLDGEVT
jgi:hypothetical protein